MAFSPLPQRTILIGSRGMLARAVQHVATRPLRVWSSADVDIRSAEAVERAFARDTPQLVINCAAWTDVDGAEAHREEAFALNATGPANLATACAKAGARLIHVSTDYVFDGRKDTPWVETDPTGPLGVYGESKLAGERQVAARCPDHVIARTAWLYGPWSRRSFVDTMLKLTAERDSVDAVSDVRGSPTFSIDLALALLFLAGQPFRGIVHAVNSGWTTWHGFASLIVKESGRPCTVRPVLQSAFPRPARRPANSVLDTTKLESMGWPMRPWEQALHEYLADFAGIRKPSGPPLV